ncbi:MAG: Lrp/AsnC family transcriptional regulator, partial [Candidatus Nanohaloarchaea archaeon]
MDIDETDLAIIEYLQRDGRASLRELADELELSPSTVSNRFHELESNGVIQGFQPKLDYEQIGFGITAVVDIGVEAGYKDDLVPDMSERDEILSEFVVTGDTDIVLICKFVDRQHMYDFIRDLQQEGGIADTKTKVVLDAVTEYGSVSVRDAL